MRKIKIGLLARIVLAIALGVLVGSFAPESVVQIMATFNGLFGNFLGFVVPLIIIAFIAPGIAQLGKGSGKLLGLATVFAYSSTIVAGFLALFVASNVLPKFISSSKGESFENPEEFLATAFFTVDMPPALGIMTALLLAFIFGIGMASTNSEVLKRGFDEFNIIIEKVISNVIIPLLPIHIFGIFMNMTFGGQVAKILSVFAIVFVLVILLHFTMLLLQYSTAGALNNKNPFKLLKIMSPAYFTALGTQSSAATIPVTLRQARKTGASEKVTDFTVPLFATIHLSGSTITIVTCAIGVLLLNGQAIELKEMVPFIFMVGITMIAAPGVPGGAVMAAIGLLSSMLGFNETMIALMIALYLAQDSFGTATNVTGDGALALIVNRFSRDKAAKPDLLKS
ncbi:dicarboxylate/amino acid:cation symporter [Paenisporosarcina antarctica]|uniref:Dicarboxylate/amino acid:cation symporter n=1 Tax=Paenisporosarcina antarctica TaxID=417367 RepID=A0A4P6ZWU5_9BACL|nr:dicarboxylate/amino acid:cation symporter [Paenisporosarcina antarctica]QBP40529.1 dicarboxylate/amino acid:cation symporter [Paenisporosarcina antarctica]